MTTTDLRLAGAAVGCLAAVLALGAYVAHRPLTPLDVASMSLRGHGMPLAILFTRSGYWPALLGIFVVLVSLEWAMFGGVAFALVLAGTQLLAQVATNVVKDLFQRIRPDDWLYHQELGFSFPSGHSVTTIVFYAGLLVFVWKAPLPNAIRLIASVALAVWIVGIPWSRMALSAHYSTDVIGGLLFGAGWLCAMLLLLRHLPGAHIRV